MSNSHLKIRRPILRYHGGKFRLAPWIISHFPMHRVYVEPYGGAASVLMRKPRTATEVYNDMDGEVVNTFRVLQHPKQARKLKDVLLMTPFAREEFNLSYQPTTDRIERARRLLIRSFMGFGSAVTRPNRDGTPQRTGFRANSNCSGTSPAVDWRNLLDSLSVFTDRLRGVVIENRDALEVLKQHDSPLTLLYVDPPYPHETRGADAGGSQRAYRFEMTTADHERLAARLRECSGMVVVSTYPCELYERLYSGWHREERIALADGARRRVEALYLNKACRSQQLQQPLLA